MLIHLTPDFPPQPHLSAAQAVPEIAVCLSLPPGRAAQAALGQGTGKRWGGGGGIVSSQHAADVILLCGISFKALQFKF